MNFVINNIMNFEQIEIHKLIPDMHFFGFSRFIYENKCSSKCVKSFPLPYPEKATHNFSKAL